MTARPGPPPCPSKGKRRFPDRAAAEHALGTLWRKARGGVLPCRAYSCVCGHYHLTSKARDDYAPVRGELVSRSTDPSTPIG